MVLRLHERRSGVKQSSGDARGPSLDRLLPFSSAGFAGLLRLGQRPRCAVLAQGRRSHADGSTVHASASSLACPRVPVFSGLRWPLEERRARQGSRRGPAAQSGRASTLVPRSPVCASLSSPGSDGSFSPRDIVRGVVGAREEEERG